MVRRSRSSGSVFICHLLCAMPFSDGIAAFFKTTPHLHLPHAGPHLTPGSGVRWGPKMGSFSGLKLNITILPRLPLHICTDRISMF